LLIPFYYWVEGRKRFFGHHTVNKWAVDGLTNYLWPIGLVGFILMGAVTADMSIFSSRIWIILWALWALAFAGYWIYYFGFRHRLHLAAYRAQRTKERYMPQPRTKRRSARAAGAR
jgi:hypothetical protein